MAFLEAKTEWAVYKELLPAGWNIPGRQQQSNRDLEQRERAYRTYHGMYYRKYAGRR